MISLTRDEIGRLPALDGWRGISILCVLAGHMLPLGPKFLQLNETIAAVGMSLFFILSGFLIVSILARNDNVISFLIRRLFRIVPLAWTYLVIVLLVHRAPLAAITANLLFYANLPPFYLDYNNGQFWSLGVEMQFYAAIALVVACLGRLGLGVVPIACILVTAARVLFGVHASIVTWFRIDEILAGGCLALIFLSPRLSVFARRLPLFIPLVLVPLVIASCHPASGALNYFRPYFAASLIGSSLLCASSILDRVLCGKALGYLARVSYALYVVHGITYSGWMGEGDVIVRYTKRVGSFFLTFPLAHLSTLYYEKYWNYLGHAWARNIERNAIERKSSVADAMHAAKIRSIPTVE